MRRQIECDTITNFEFAPSQIEQSVATWKEEEERKRDRGGSKRRGERERASKLIHKREEKLNEVDKWRRYRCVRKKGNYWWGPQMASQIGTLVNVFDQAVMKLFAIMERVMKMQKFINGGKPLGRTSAGMLSKFELILWILFCWLFSSLESEFALFFKSPLLESGRIAEMPALAEPRMKWVWEKEEDKE